MALAFSAFFGGAAVSLATSWVLVTRLERLGERVGLSEALLGVVAALAADAPEITASISAMSHHQRVIGAGVVVGSNVFNLAALLGLGAVVSGFIALHRRVVLLGGVVAGWIAAWCVATTAGLVPVTWGLALSGLVLVAYMLTLGVRPATLLRARIAPRAVDWLAMSVAEEESELLDAIRPVRGRPVDAAAAAGSLVVVVVASVAMERAASTLGHHFHIADAIVGGVALAAITSLPNAVAAVHLAARGRGAAALSTALTSNNLNVVVGLFIPGAIVGVASSSAAGNVTAVSYVVLTAFVLVAAYARRGLSRRTGALIIVGYGVFLAALLAAS